MTDQVITEQEDVLGLNTSKEANESFYSQFVGEGKKYTDDENLAKGYANAEKHIETLLQEKRELESKLIEKEAASKSIDEVVSYLEKTKVPDKKEDSEQVDIRQQVTEIISAEKRLEAENKVRSETKKLLVDTFGSESIANEKINAYINGSDDRKTTILTLSKSDPNGLLKLISTEEVKKTITNPTIGSNSNTNSGDTVINLTWTECTKIRKEDPKRYNTPEFRKQMEMAVDLAKESGIDFFNT